MPTIVTACGGHCWSGGVGAAPPAGEFSHWETSFSSGLGSFTRVTSPTGLSSGENAIRALLSVAGNASLLATVARYATKQLVVRYKFRFQNFLPNTLTGGVTSLFGTDDGVSDTHGLWYRESTNSVFTRAKTTSASADYPVVLDRWYVWDAYVNFVASPHEITSQITDMFTGVATSLGTQAAGTGAGNILYTEIIPGFFGSNNGKVDMLVTAYAASVTPADYPLGNGKVLAVRPARDGTHVPGAVGTFKIDATTNITGAETTLYQNLDDDPLGSTTDRLTQHIIDAASYLEIRPPADIVTTATPRNVTVVSALRNEALTLANGITLQLVSGGNTDTFVNNASLAQTSLIYFSKGFSTAPGGAAWTKALVEGLLVRYGFASDIDPVPALHALLLEVEYPAYLVEVTGTATASITETDVVAGGKTIIITLTNDTWVQV